MGQVKKGVKMTGPWLVTLRSWRLGAKISLSACTEPVLATG